MLTVAILINGNPIMARSAVRRERLQDGRVAYLVDDGATIQHDPDDGAEPNDPSVASAHYATGPKGTLNVARLVMKSPPSDAKPQPCCVSAEL